MAAGFAIDDRAWPVVGYGMFSDSPQEHVTWRLDVHTRSGGRAPLRPADIGITEPQLRRFLGGRVATADGTLRPDAAEAVGFLVALWNSRRPSDPATEVRVAQRVLRETAPRVPTNRAILTWRAP